MSEDQALDPIDSYLREINALLPYPVPKKLPILEDLRKDVEDAMGSEKRPPSVVFGSPTEVAKNLSLANDWGTSPAGWGTRVLASVIDYVATLGVFILFAIVQFVLSDFQIDEIRWNSMQIPLGFLFFGIPIISLLLSYFIILEKTYSTTLGKRMLGLIVVDESGINITWTQSLIRNFTKVPFLTSFLLFDIIFGIVSEKTRGRKQRVLDFVAGTKVVQHKKQT